MTLRELQEKRERLVSEARERLSQITANTDESRTAELETQHDAAMGSLDTLDAQIAREQRVADAEHRQDELRDRETRGRRPVQAVGETGAAGDDDAITYRDAFHAYIRAEGQLAMLDPEVRAVLQAGYQAVKPEERAQTTATTAAGGYTVPTELQAEIVRTMKMWGPLYDPTVTREWVTASGANMPIPTIDDTGDTGAATTQGVALADDGSGDAVFGQKQLEAYAFATPWLRVSKELADDSILAIESLLGDLLGERLGRLANAQLTNGTGSNAPHGIVAASASGVTGASSTAIVFDEIIKLEHSVDPAYRESPKVRYMLNDSTLMAIRLLKDGQGNYLWNHGNVQQGVAPSLNGRAYSINQAMANIATGNKSILFGDFNKYIVRKVGAPLIGAIQDKDFWPGFGIAGWIRFDGELVDVAAVKALAQP